MGGKDYFMDEGITDLLGKGYEDLLQDAPMQVDNIAGEGNTVLGTALDDPLLSNDELRVKPDLVEVKLHVDRKPEPKTCTVIYALNTYALISWPAGVQRMSHMEIESSPASRNNMKPTGSRCASVLSDLQKVGKVDLVTAPYLFEMGQVTKLGLSSWAKANILLFFSKELGVSLTPTEGAFPILGIVPNVAW